MVLRRRIVDKLKSFLTLLVPMVLVLSTVTGIVYSTPAQAAPSWWNTDWLYRKVLSFNTAAETTFPLDSDWRFTVDSSALADYGLGYPVTYVFRLPEGVSSLSVLYRFAPSVAFQTLVEKSSSDFFNGIDAVRFNYSENRAYVSVSFNYTSSDIYLRFQDVSSNLSDVQLLGISNFYDNRKTAVVLSADDINGGTGAIGNLTSIIQARKLWTTYGIQTGATSPAGWADLQVAINGGYIEVASHSRTHPHVPYSDNDSEVGGSAQDIKDNLDPLSIQKRGNSEYVWAWIRPHGESDATIRAKLGEYKYLADRYGTVHTLGEDWSSWDFINGTYNLCGVLYEAFGAGSSNLDTLNRWFDAAYLQYNGVYPFYVHPGGVTDWTPTGNFTRHLDYISGKTDVWYVGLGSAYVYHYAGERGIVTATPSGGTSAQVSIFTAGNDFIDYPLIVSLDSSNFDFTKAQANGEDIRFVDKNDTTSLPYIITSWNSTSEEAHLVVRVSKIDSGSNYADSIYIYYGNGVALDAQSSAYSVLVNTNPAIALNAPLYGLTGTTFASPDIYRNTVTASGATWSYLGRVFDGVNDQVAVGDNSTLDFGASDNFTILTWFKSENTTPAQGLVIKGLVDNALGAGDEGYSLKMQNGVLRGELQDIDSNLILSHPATIIVEQFTFGGMIVNRKTNWMTLYNNLADSTRGDITNEGDLSNAQNAVISSYPGNLLYLPFKGIVSESRIYREVVDSFEMNQENREIRFRHGSGSVYFGGAYPEPTPVTLTPTGVGAESGTHATLRGNLSSLGSVPTGATIWFEWGYDTNYGHTVGIGTVGSVGTYTYGLTGFDPSGTIYYRFVGENSYGVAYGSPVTFKAEGLALNVYSILSPTVFFIWIGVVIIFVLVGLGIGLPLIPTLISGVILITIGSAGIGAIIGSLSGWWR